MLAHTLDGFDDEGLMTKQRVQQLAAAYQVQRMLRRPKTSRARHLAVRTNEREQTAERLAWREEARMKRDYAAVAAR